MPFVLGLNHRTAPVSLREKLAISPNQLPEMLVRLKEESKTEEVVCLSTCNRTEVYMQANDRRAARQALERILETHAGTGLLSLHLYYHESEQAVEHLFSVASGLDSMIQGEHEILAQVKQAYQTAHHGGFTGKLLNVLFQRSLYVGKRVRTETGLGEGAASVGSVAVGMAERIFGSLKERTVMILGAGQMAELTAKHLLAQKARSLLVANRTFERACELAKEFGGTAMHFEEGLRQMAEVDIVICSTAAPHSIITSAHVRGIMEKRKGRSLFLIDIAMPRDVDPAVNDLENVYLYNIDDLEQIVSQNQTRRSKEAAQALRIIQDETREFTRWLRAHRAGLHQGLRHNTSSTPSVASGTQIVLMQVLRLGTRKSALAQAQAHWVANKLRTSWRDLQVELVQITTSGDLKTEGKTIDEGGLKALFTKEIEEALLDNKIDLAVHSLKDMAAVLPKGLVIGAVPEREDPWDVWISRTKTPFGEIPKNAKIGTGAIRRQAQLKRILPDAKLVAIRGNVDTRLQKLSEGALDGLILALAGLKRLGREKIVTDILEVDVLLPAVGQGCLGIQVREKDLKIVPFLKLLDHPASHSAAKAERAFLKILGGSCQTPIAGYASIESGELVLRGLVISPDGQHIVSAKENGRPFDAEGVGERLAQKLLQAGAANILR